MYRYISPSPMDLFNVESICGVGKGSTIGAELEDVVAGVAKVTLGSSLLELSSSKLPLPVLLPGTALPELREIPCLGRATPDSKLRIGSWFGWLWISLKLKYLININSWIKLINVEEGI